ncbi:hypothetical protein M9H77_19404 [Catharanthus roseus]|uniref:Uncharacterized protein n=1 Tax=Catharanthus roseus TaxID=4058 RepID=A0ACC0BA76_CATRO|nr:hypothetical protein M9H77_19404 [Catharanthus roseus]
MRGRSSKQGSKEGLDMDKLDKLKQEPHLSGAYIRSLVKQLTSTRTKDPLNSKEQDSLEVVEGFSSYQNLTKTGDGFSENQQQSQPPQQPTQQKKQVRRRLHTSRPYQERLLNMAEARREIVTALKFHRAAMKQQQQQQQHQQETELQPSQQPPLQQQQSLLEQEVKAKSRRNSRTSAASDTSNNLTNYVDNFSYQAFPCPPNYPYSSWSTFPPVASPFQPENLNFALPNQTLGLNLNLQDFNNLDNNFYHCNNNPTTIYSNSSPSSSSSPPLQPAMEEVPSLVIPQEGIPMMVTNNEETSMFESGDLGLHHAMDDKEMAEIRSIGEQHQMEWNDTLNLVTSAWWFKFLKTMEIDPQEQSEDFVNHPFDEIMELPSWLNANEGCLEQHLSDYYSDEYMQDPALPCMEIEEIEGMDGEWLS